MPTGPVQLQGITINAGILETLQGFSTQRNLLKGITIGVGTGASIMQLKVVDRNHEPIEGATCRVLNAIGSNNNVLSFDGVDDYALISAAETNISSFSVDFWFYANSYADNRGFFSKGTNTARQIWSWWFSNNIRINIGGTSYTLVSNFNTIGQWIHICFTFSGTELKGYLNGNLLLTQAKTHSVFNDSNIYIGKINGFGTHHGNISNFRWWNKVLTLEEIAAVKDTRIKTTKVDIVGNWPMDEGSGTSILDYSGNNNNGTIFGATWTESDESFPLFDNSIQGYETTPYDTQTTNANGLCTLNYQINNIHGLEVTLPGKRRFIMPFQRTTRGLLDWQVMLSDYLATFATDRGNILINSEPENNDANFLIE